MPLQLFLVISFVILSGVSLADAPPSQPGSEAIKTESGLAHQMLKEGSDDVKPVATDMVTVHYIGWLSNGHKFDDSVARGQPVTFPLDRVIKGWTEGLQLMRVGEKRRFWIPQDLAYGDRPKLGAPQGDLIFDIELLAVKKPQPAPDAPEDLAAAPAEAETHDAGLRSIQLQKGTDTAKPKADSVVKVHYSGWDSAGNLVDSSTVRDEPLIAPLNRVIRGWSIGIQLMTVGEKRRFWIPEQLAYGSNPPSGAPKGQLVFDIELLEIVND